jgi:preprotein translocase subunit SecG
MMILVTLVHVIFSFLLIAIVLLQDPKSSGGGGMFGGGGANSVLGSTGAVTFLTKLTQWSAVTFGVTCILLSLMSRPDIGSVLDSAPANAKTTGLPAGAPVGSGPLDSNPAAQKDPKQAGTEAAPAQGDHVVPAEAIRAMAPETPKKPKE